MAISLCKEELSVAAEASGTAEVSGLTEVLSTVTVHTTSMQTHSPHSMRQPT